MRGGTRTEIALVQPVKVNYMKVARRLCNGNARASVGVSFLRRVSLRPIRYPIKCIVYIAVRIPVIVTYVFELIGWMRCEARNGFEVYGSWNEY